MSDDPAVAWCIVGALYAVLFGFMGWMAWMGYKARKRRQHRDSRGCQLWEIDTGESVWVAAASRDDAIQWYFNNGDLDTDFDEDLDDCCAKKPCLLSVEHYRELGMPSEGKETYRDTMEKHHNRRGPIPFLVSTTCG